MATEAPPHAYEGDESSPMMRPMSPLSIGSICTCLIVGTLASCWCILDYWNREITRDLFSIGSVRTMDLDKDGDPEVIAPFSNFNYPLTLAFLQFAFMTVFFLGLHFSVNQERPRDLATLNWRLKLSSDKRWPALVISHVFSTFWLQALMMPAQMLSIPLFAATRAVEIPMTAALRSQVLGPRYGKKNAVNVALAFAATCAMFFSYAKLAGCACVWSGSGVALSGFAFWTISLLLLAMPAANAVCQEAVMLQPGMHPLLLLSLQNAFACFIFGPILLVCHLMGWEDVSGAFQMILTFGEVFMLVLWLCVQMAATSLLGITLIHLVDSFWMVTLRAARVLFWALCILATFYTSNRRGLPMSVASPWGSFWSFMMMCGALLGAAAIYKDHVYTPEESPDKSETATATEKGSASASATP